MLRRRGERWLPRWGMRAWKKGSPIEAVGKNTILRNTFSNLEGILSKWGGWSRRRAKKNSKWLQSKEIPQDNLANLQTTVLLSRWGLMRPLVSARAEGKKSPRPQAWQFTQIISDPNNYPISLIKDLSNLAFSTKIFRSIDHCRAR